MKTEELYEIFKRHPKLTTDTRKLEKDAIFFALRGASFNGNEFAEKAIAEGCAYAVVDDKSLSEKGPAFIVVDDVLDSLQKLARHHRRQMNIPVIGITGTNGKTTTKELVSAVLSQKYNVLFTQGNLNNHIGVPLTLLSLTKEHEIAVIEMGANHIGEIDILSRIAEPGYGIITNIGRAHLEGFGSPQGIIKTKSELYRFIKEVNGTLFVNGDNDLLTALSQGINKITYGQGGSNDVSARLVKADPFVVFEWKDKDGAAHEVSSNLIGSYNLENLLCACAIGTQFGVEPSLIERAISGYQPSNNRSQVLKTTTNTLVMDAYNANPTSMEAALKSFAEMNANSKWVILGDMLELGTDSEKEHKAIVDSIEKKNLSNAILIGPEFRKAAGNKFNSFSSVDEAKDFIQKSNIKDSVILLKGSRGMKLESLTALL